MIKNDETNEERKITKRKIVQEIGLSGKELRQNLEFPNAHKHVNTNVHADMKKTGSSHKPNQMRKNVNSKRMRSQNCSITIPCIFVSFIHIVLANKFERSERL